MKKFLSIFFVGVVVLSIMASASDSIQTKIKAMAGDKMYSSAIVPMPDQPDQQKNLAAKENDAE